jgi:hypothetical protein
LSSKVIDAKHCVTQIVDVRITASNDENVKSPYNNSLAINKILNELPNLSFTHVHITRALNELKSKTVKRYVSWWKHLSGLCTREFINIFDGVSTKRVFELLYS